MPDYAIGFNHNGAWTAFPSVFTQINAEALDVRNQGPTGVMAILAAGDGLFEPKVATSLPFDIGSPSRFLAPGDLRTAAEFATRRFANPEITGPGQIFVVPVSPSTQSTITLEEAGPTLLATLTSLGWGTKMNDILVKSEAGTLTITLPTDAGANLQEVYDYTTVAGLVAEINARSGIVSAAFTAEGTPQTFVDTAMAGATSPAPTASDWADAFTALDPIKVQVVSVCSADSAVWAMLVSHLAVNRGRGFVGSATVRNWNGSANRATAITALKAEIALLSSPRVMHCCLGAEGLAGHVSTAPRYAALAAGLVPSVPMTFKGLDLMSLEARLSKDEVGGVTGLLLNGGAPPVPDPSAPSTFIVSRGLSTWTTDANLYRREHSVLAAVDAIQDEIETRMRAFLGLEGSAAVLGRARSTVIDVLNRATAPNAAIRINGFNEESVVVSFSGDTVLRVTASITPIPPINFVVTTLALERTDITITQEISLAASPQV